MRTVLCILFLVLFVHLAFSQQVQQRPVFMDRGVVHHGASIGSVTANDPRPLHQAVIAIREEYGWVVDFEDPLYESQDDLVDDTAPLWRAKHPDSKGVRRIAGRLFHSDYPERPNLATAESEEEKVLKKVVSDYNSSGNPGKFEVRNEGNGRLVIVGEYVKDTNGQDKRTTPILDTPVTIENGTRTVEETILQVLESISARTGVKVSLGGWANNILKQTQVTAGGANVPARNILVQALEGTKRRMVADLLFDPDFNSYSLHIKLASLVKLDATGERTTVPIDRLGQKIANHQNAKSPGQ
jgi:hypothetical protein